MSMDISELMDGESDDAKAKHAHAALRNDPAARQAWDDYHLIGDALRGNATHVPQLQQRIMAALEQEPTVIAPRALPARAKSWMRYSVAAAASIAAIGLLSYLVPAQQGAPQPAQVAQSQSVPVGQWERAAPNDHGRAIIDTPQTVAAELEPYLQAHRELSPAIRPAAFVRGE